ncbi:type I-E CRISPR-associated protein Cse1/CasA [Chloroflexus sp.]|uniref:type I-E CRISPR-associated protein Cse1/CasA n=1 Tax=Chloroflexus sp. TaxID=1904827 RepID=UPI00298F348B|nr:type I-E CRISPR-associated protein Cse1/CasA [Chloroflexus sp.]MDW8404835.1 type I-E CRISPR-associated protein Cse1/CasA [Chloroflexus sp.]
MNVSPQFNLWTEPWIRVIRNNRRDDEVSIHECLLSAHELIALSDPSPLVVGGTHRLLAAILQAIYQPTNIDAIANVLRNGKFDAYKLNKFGREYAQRFDLFHPQTPFLQTGDVPLDGWKKPAKGQKSDWGSPQPIARLFAEVPVATERTHFNHVTDEDHQYCPACCARGLVTVPAFASSGGAGMRPSINGVPPIYIFPIGDTLFETLALSLISSDFQPRAADPERKLEAIWTTSPPIVQKDYEVSTVGYIESLTFPARRMRLYPHSGSATCTYCGRSTNLYVSNLLFEKGHWLNKKVGVWDDPFVAFRKKKEELQSIRPEEGKALWREYSYLLLEQDDSTLRPRAVQQIVRLIDREMLKIDQLVRFRCIGIRTDGKAKNFEWLDETLEAPPALLTDIDAAEYVAEAIQRATEVASILKNTFNRHFRPERRPSGRDRQDLVRFKSVRDRMIADYWRALGLQFRQFLNGLASAAVPPQRDNVANSWVQSIVTLARTCFDAALEQIGNRAFELQARVEAKQACDAQLNIKREEWLK